MMKKLLFVLAVISVVACKKDAEKILVENQWEISAITVNPALTVGNKTTTNYLEYVGPGSCDANNRLTFSDNGKFIQVFGGALCDREAIDPAKENSVTWKKDGHQIIVSSMPDNPYVLQDNILTQTRTLTKIAGSTHTLMYVYHRK